MRFFSKILSAFIAMYSAADEQAFAKTMTKFSTIEISATAVSQNDERLALGYSNGNIQVIQVANGEILANIHNASSAELGIASLSFNHSGKWLAVGDWDENIAVWDWVNKKKLSNNKVEDTPDSIFFSQNSEQLGVVSDEGLELFDVRLKRRILKDERLRVGVQYSKDWQKIAMWGYSENDSHLIRIYDAKDLTLIQSLETEEYVDNVQFSHQNKSLVALNSNSLTRWDIESGNVQKELETDSYGGMYIDAHDNQLIVYDENSWDVRSIETGEVAVTQSLPAGLKIESVSSSLSHDYYLVEVDARGEGYHFEREAYIYDGLNSQPTRVKPRAPQASYGAKLLAGELVLFAGEYPAEVWDLANSNLLYRVFLDEISSERTMLEDINIQRPEFSIGSNVTSLTFRQNGSSLLVGSEEFPDLSLMNRDGKFEAFVPIGNGNETYQSDFIAGSNNAVVNLGASGVQIWGLPTMQQLSNFNFEMGAQRYALSKDQTLIAVASSIGEVGIWNLSDFKKITNFQLKETLAIDDESGEDDFNFGGMLWIDNDQHLLFAGNRGLIKTSKNGENQSLIMEGDATALFGLGSTSKAERFAVGFDRGPVHILDENLSSRYELKHDGVMDVKYDSGSNTLFTLSAYATEDGNNDLLAWNLATGKSAQCIVNSEQWLSKMAYDVEGKTLYVSDQDGTLHRIKWSSEC